MNKNNYKEFAHKYLKAGYSTIPDKYMSKRPAITGWNKSTDTLLDKDKVEEYVNYTETNLKGESNIALLLGKGSGIVALDFDCDNPEITALFEKMDILPKSPVSKVSSKSDRFTRFFKYSGEKTEMLKFNGEVILEILSTDKKTTIPPSIHPNGSPYKWSSDKTLLDIDKEELPVLPPALIQSLEILLKNTFGGSVSESYGKVINGRNDALSKHLTSIVNDNHTVDQAIQSLIEFDKQNNEVPLFTDPEENRHIEPYSNALQFYSNHITSFNTARMRENKEFIVPIMEAVSNIDSQKERELGKSQSKESQRKSKVEFLVAPSALKNSVQTILKNSWIKQPELAFGASLALFSTLTSRKFVYQGISPNLYILNVSNSGTGKNNPMEFVKNTLARIGAQDLLGAGDYVSDASLMDSLPTKNVRLDVMDEVGGILKTINSGKSEFNSKMADVLAELYTSSNSYYMGRAVASGYDGGLVVKGACFRPNVNILGSTTPTGLREGVSKRAIDKGLLGRFLIFQGSALERSTRVKQEAQLSQKDLDHLRWLVNYTPNRSGVMINDIDQRVTELKATKEADELLDKVFKEFDDKRINTIQNTEGPITARLYQQMVKLVIIHAASREHMKVPTIETIDVEFGRNVINSFFEEIGKIVSELVFNSPHERDRHLILNLVKNSFKINKKEVILKTQSMNKRVRDSILEELIEAGQIETTAEKVEGKIEVFYHDI